MYLSPYVEKPLNSKVIKSFVPKLRSRKCFSCFGIPMFYVYMLWTFYVRFTYSCVAMLQFDFVWIAFIKDLLLVSTWKDLPSNKWGKYRMVLEIANNLRLNLLHWDGVSDNFLEKKRMQVTIPLMNAVVILHQWQNLNHLLLFTIRKSKMINIGQLIFRWLHCFRPLYIIILFSFEVH